MFKWFTRLRKAGKVAVISTVVVVTGAAGATGVVLTNSSSRTTSNQAPSTAQPDAPNQANCPSDLAYTTRSPGSGNIENLQTALFLKTDCQRTTKQITAKRPTDVKWSPDGRFVAFTDLEANADPNAQITDYRTAPARELYISDRSGNVRQVTQLGNHSKISQPVWSADGKTLGFLCKQADDPNPTIYTVASDGSSLKKLASGQYRGLTWSGAKLFTLEQRADHTAIVSIAPATSNIALVADLGSVYAQTFNVSPDGRHLLYDQAGKIPHEIWSYDTEFNLNTKITTAPRNNLGLSLTTDWRLLYGAYEPEGNGNPFPANDQERIGIHSIDLNNNTDTIILPDQGIGSLDVVRTAVAKPTPLALLPDFEFVSLGDSYSSGEGAPVRSADGKVRYIVGTDTDTNKCHRSMGAYPVLTHEAVGKGSGFIFKACSGAVVEDFWSPYSKNHNGANPTERSQLDWLNAKTKVVTLTIGGNNTHFGEVMEYCAQRTIIQPSCQAQWQGAIDSAIRNLKMSGSTHDNLPELYAAIKQKAPNATIYVLGYPRFFSEVPFGTCATGVPDRMFLGPDMIWINAEIERLNDISRQAASQANLKFVDVYEALKGHELCSLSPWIHNADGILDVPFHTHNQSQSYHYNIAGQAAISKLIEQAITK